MTGEGEVLVVGSAARDVVHDDPRRWRLGGGVTYGGLTLARLGLRPRVLVGVDRLAADAEELDALREALTAEGIPACVSNSAGTYLCNQTLYRTLHAVRELARPPRVGFVHFPLLPAMVAASGLEQPSMDFPLMLRAVEVILAVLAR